MKKINVLIAIMVIVIVIVIVIVTVTCGHYVHTCRLSIMDYFSGNTIVNIFVDGFWSNVGDDLMIIKAMKKYGKRLGIDFKVVDTNENIDILLFSNWMKDISRYDSNIVKIAFTGESYKPEQWDYLIGFDLPEDHCDKQNQIFRMPLWMSYHDFYLLEQSEDLKYVKTHSKPYAWPTRSKQITMVNRWGGKGREELVQKYLDKGLEIDFPSNFMNNMPSIEDQGYKSKHDFLLNYNYNICAENVAQNNYCTEKLFDALFAGCIPIYWDVNTNLSNFERSIVNIERVMDMNDIDANVEIIQSLTQTEELMTKPIFTDEAVSVIEKYWNEDFVSFLKKVIESVFSKKHNPL